VTGQWFSLGTPVSSTYKTDFNDITEMLLKVALNTITLIRFHFTLILITGTPTIPVLPATIGTSSAGQVGGIPFQPLPNFTASGAAIPSSMSFYD
jgi:hypothetical protein